MCRNDVAVKAQPMLAALLREIAVALCPDDPDAVVIGPVDFGSERVAAGSVAEEHE